MNSYLINENWYVAYTYPRAERKAQKKLEEMGVTCFLPMQKVVRQWSDRKKKLEVPLFPNYIFVRTNRLLRHNIVKVPELLYFVSSAGEPVVVPDEVIFSLEKVTGDSVEVLNENVGKVGDKIRITEGKFMGVEGVVLRKNGKTRLAISVEALQQSVLIDIPVSYAEEVC